MRVKILPIIAVGLTSITSKINADINFDSKIDELKKQGFDIKIDEIKEKVYSYDELERKRNDEKYRLNDEFNRIINTIESYNQKNHINVEIDKDVKLKNEAIDRANDEIIKDNERLLKEWNSKNKEIEEYNILRKSKVDELNKTNSMLNDKLKKDYESKKVEIEKNKNEIIDDKIKIDKEIGILNDKIKKENEERIRLVNEENERRKLKHANEVNRIDNEYNNAVTKYKNDKAKIELENSNILKSNKEKETKYTVDLEKYNKVIADNKLKKEEYEKNLNKINEENKKKELEKNKKEEEYNNLKKNIDAEIKKEEDLIISSGGKKGDDVEKILPKKLDVTASGKIDIVSVNDYETITNTELNITLPDGIIENGSYVDLKYQRLREEQLKNQDVILDGVKIGVVKLIDVKKERNSDYVEGDYSTVDGYTDMHTYTFRLIFNEEANKFKGRSVQLRTSKTANWNGFYAVEKTGVTHNIYANDKLVVSSKAHNIPATPLAKYKEWNYISNDGLWLGVFINEKGEIRPNGLFGRISNSHHESIGRGYKFEDGDIITYTIDKNSPVKFDTSKGIDPNNIFWSFSNNFGKYNKYGTLIPNDTPLPKFEVINFTDTEIKIKMTNVSDKYVSLRTDSYKRIPLKIVSYDKNKYTSDKKYSMNTSLVSKDGVVKTHTEQNNVIGIAGVGIDAVGVLKPFNDEVTYKIKVNYVDEQGKTLKQSIEQNDLLYGDKYKVGVPKINDYVFTSIKDNKKLEGMFDGEHKEITLVYKKLNRPEKPELPIPTPVPSSPEYFDETPPVKPVLENIKPLPVEPVKEKYPELVLIKPTPGRDTLTPPSGTLIPLDIKPPMFKPNDEFELLPLNPKPKLKDLLPKLDVSNKNNVVKPSIVVKKYVYEYLNSSQGTGVGVRDLKNKRSSYGNTLILRNLL